MSIAKPATKLTSKIHSTMKNRANERVSSLHLSKVKNIYFIIENGENVSLVIVWRVKFVITFQLLTLSEIQATDGCCCMMQTLTLVISCGIITWNEIEEIFEIIISGFYSQIVYTWKVSNVWILCRIHLNLNSLSLYYFIAKFRMADLNDPPSTSCWVPSSIFNLAQDLLIFMFKLNE